ncbi:MAG: biotin--[acetyl-CoA-carboxylase] ligase [Rickettsiales bacterium]|nr:biotin--[acetyl-CoA-carboxylase] ligase [Rickettsiales bacterium]
MKEILFDIYFNKSSLNTNDEIRNLIKTNDTRNNLALFTLEQKKGRGRMNREWISNKGDLICSFLINQKISTKEIGKVNIWFSQIILNLIKTKIPNQNFKIKWPNDIYFDEKKLAGILIETNIIENKIQNIVIGLGLNFISTPRYLNYKTICISKFSKNIKPLNFFISLVLEMNKSLTNFKKILSKFTCLDIKDNFKNFGEVIKIKINNKVVEGIFSDLNDSGELILKVGNKYRVINYGEII